MVDLLICMLLIGVTVFNVLSNLTPKVKGMVGLKSDIVLVGVVDSLCSSGE